MEFLGGCDCGEPDERGVAALKLEEPEEQAVVEEQQQGVKTVVMETGQGLTGSGRVGFSTFGSGRARAGPSSGFGPISTY